MPKVLIASSLADGFVRFLNEAGEWSRAIGDSAIAHSDAEAEALLAKGQSAEAANIVIDPYLIEVEIEGAKPKPVEYREYIRAMGPSVPTPL